MEPSRFERGRQLAGAIDDLDEEGWSLFGTVLDDGRPYRAMVDDCPAMSAECDCPERGPPSLCGHLVAVGLRHLGDDRDV